MKFSGHETFPVREGWLHKGMKLLNESPEQFLNEEVADLLGVGRNMAKSIRHWLVVTGLAETAGVVARGRATLLQPTDLGQLIWQHDPYFLTQGTWWILHANLINNFSATTTWYWFFNNFSHDRFDRAVCLESLRRFVESSQKRVPSTSTLSRDLGCMLLSYARSIPAGNDDPEDGSDCPFRELGLMSYYRTSGYFHVHNGTKEIPGDVFGYVMSLAFSDSFRSGKKADVKLQEAARKPGGPGRAFCLNSESLFETVSQIEAKPQQRVQITGIAGDRAIRLPCMRPDEWATVFYEMNEEAAHV